MDTDRDRSCQPWRNTVVMGFSFPWERSDTEFVGEVGVVWHRYQECLPHNSRFYTKINKYMNFRASEIPLKRVFLIILLCTTACIWLTSYYISFLLSILYNFAVYYSL
jgi:hypothetical protein